jgi:putative ABC transport system permease protein
VRLVPLRYPLRSIGVRWTASLFSAVGIGLTVAVLGAVLALRQGFQSLVSTTGRDDVGVYLRPGATSEGESVVRHPGDSQILATRPEVDSRSGLTLGATESYLGIKLAKIDGSGTTIVTVRGIEPASLAIVGDRLRVVEGRAIQFGADEVMVGRRLSARIKDCRVGDTLTFNVRPFKVVGLFENDGAYGSEIWGDVVQVTAATLRPFRQRFIAQWKPGTTRAEVEEDLRRDGRVVVNVQTEREYYAAQTGALGAVLSVLAGILTTLMGLAAILGAVSTMLAAVGSRTREVGILVALGYSGFAVFLSFLAEAAAIGAIGGAIGALLILPLDGIETGTTNWNTFTEIAFAFRVTPPLLATAITIAVVLGVVGGALPAWRASRLQPTAALRRL